MINKFNEFILEKRISQISSTIDITLSFDLIKTIHAEQRQDFAKRGLNSENQNYIPNSEMSEFVNYFKYDIAKSIANGDISDGDDFVIKSIDKEMAMVLIAEEVNKTYWKLIIKTVFRESENNNFIVYKNQIVFEK